MRFILLFLVSFSALAVEHQGPCAKAALQLALKKVKGANADFSLRLPKVSNMPEEFHVYEIGYQLKEKFFHGEVSVEFVGGKCISPKIQYVTMLE